MRNKFILICVLTIICLVSGCISKDTFHIGISNGYTNHNNTTYQYATEYVNHFESYESLYEQDRNETYHYYRGYRAGYSKWWLENTKPESDYK